MVVNQDYPEDITDYYKLRTYSYILFKFAGGETYLDLKILQ